MQIWNSLTEAGQTIKILNTPTVVTIGNFDGVHRGHQRIMEKTVELANQSDALSIAIVFVNHTGSIVGERPLLLNSADIRRELLAGLGLDRVLEIEFNQEIAGLEPEVFFNEWLLDTLHCIGLVVGHDFKFGAGGRGDFQVLEDLTREKEIMFKQIAPLTEDGIIISSSKIRELLTQGQVELANRMLGYPFRIDSNVVPGEQRGRTLGFPTANMIIPSQYVLPRYGVYLTRLYINGKSYNGLANVGVKPTFGGIKPLIEVYLMDVNLDLYDKKVRVEILKFIRPEIRFSGPEALMEQIQKDIHEAEVYLN